MLPTLVILRATEDPPARHLASQPPTSYNGQTISFNTEGNEPLLILSLFHRQRAFLLTLFFFSCSLAHAATKWQDPTPEELSMTSQPQVPGAAAVILYREETVDDEAGSWTYYYRIKILTQTGRDRYSNVSIAYPVQSSNLYYNITNIAGRTIHSDGSILPFTGKPFQRIVEHSS